MGVGSSSFIGVLINHHSGSPYGGHRPANAGIGRAQGRPAGDKHSSDAGTDDGSAVIGNVSYSGCGWHKFLVDLHEAAFQFRCRAAGNFRAGGSFQLQGSAAFDIEGRAGFDFHFGPAL